MRMASNLQFVFRHVPPRAGLSYSSMIWNRCPTARRFQNYLPCVVCDGERTQDSTERYVYDNHRRRFASE
eukprot:13725270-Alexandrium_andersonii.AAC.1